MNIVRRRIAKTNRYRYNSTTFNKNQIDIGIMNNTPSFYTTLTLASLYVISGVIQPLIMEIAKQAGLTDNKCQIYMFAYYWNSVSMSTG